MWIELFALQFFPVFLFNFGRNNINYINRQNKLTGNKMEIILNPSKNKE